MRLGGPVFLKDPTPESWIAALHREKYSAAYSPIGPDSPGASDSALIAAYRAAAARANILISEVGAWSNPMSADANTRKAAIAKCQRALALADQIGANCAVNITGSRGEQWDGGDARNFTADTFDRIVAVTRTIIDGVKPRHAFYTLETMPRMLPDSAASYLALLKAIDRKQCAVHFDPVNLVASPRIYFDTGGLIRDFVKKLGRHIKNCHAKDILLQPQLTVHLDEVRPGLGNLDYRTFVTAIHRLNPQIPLMLEHLPNPAEYRAAAKHVRAIAKKVRVPIL
ncbi:MAG TPA: TIM barrel protein [Planctomycetota bacterium]|nr:TIM barrel protein [Planctomycetota bacterium]